jgi:predicted HD superfamily hydrolase involved in NAD metabolism
VRDVERALVLLCGRGLSVELETHCHGVATTAAALAALWGADGDEATVAGLLHDYCRELDRQEVIGQARKHGLTIGGIEARYPVQLLHGPLAAAVLESEGFAGSVLDAIARHTIGGTGMSPLARCLFVADASEPGRAYLGVDEVRRLAKVSLDDAVALVVGRDVRRLTARGREVHPAMMALDEELNGTRD